jgi:putative zinc finger/helix-turn-helix YgiT family protein
MKIFKRVFCTECLEEVKTERISKKKTFKVKGENVEIVAHYYKCPQCNELMYDPDNPDENFELAYNEYRKRKGLLFPDQIAEVRKKYGLSQRQTAKLLGWSHATISKYESGVLPSPGHSTTLKLLSDPVNMLKILEGNKSNITNGEYKKIKDNVQSILSSQRDEILNKKIEEHFELTPNKDTGFRMFSLEKLKEIVKYFALRDEKLYKVKLNKYLFYSDFLHFKKFTVSITGLKYVHIPMGPVPDDYELLFTLLTREESGIVRSYFNFGGDYPAEKFEATEELNSNVLSEEELSTLNTVYSLLNDHNAAEVSEMSHKEEAWKETKQCQTISYEYAKDLSIS